MTFGLLIAFSRGLNLLPRWARRALGAFLGGVWFHVVRFRRAQVIENLTLAFGDEKSPREIRKLARRNFLHYGHTLVEIAQSISWTQKDYEREIPCEGIEHMREAIAQGQGVFGLTSHLGNWEWVIGAVMARGIPGDVVVKHTRNESLDRFLLWYRQNMGIGVFYESGTVREILRSLSRGRLVGFILDQFMGPPIGLPVKFFGKPAGTAIGLALLTEKRDAPIVPIYSYRDGQGRLRTVIEPALSPRPYSECREDRLYEKTQAYNDVLESHIRRHPEQWLWLHRRWKPYRGEPRWKPTRALATALLAAVLACGVGCSTLQTKEATPTGITVPPDPKVALPQVEELEPTAKPKVSPTPKAKTAAKPARKPASPEWNPPSFAHKERPFEVGERMVLSLHWTMLHAGDARLEVREGFPFQGRPTFRFWGTVLSSPMLDAMYHVDNTIESYVDKQWLLPYKFLLHMVETHQLKETRAAFDHRARRVHYWSQRVSKKWGDETHDRRDKMSPFALDMFSALYYARLLEFEMGVPQVIPVYENGKNLKVTVVPVANEVVRTKAGVFQAWKLAVTIKLNNVLKPTGDLFLWLSDDSKKYIVKFEAKLKLGALRGELTQLRERL